MRIIYPAFALLFYPAIATADITREALVGKWICEERDSKVNSMNQMHIQTDGSFQIGFMLELPHLEWTDSPEGSIIGRWQLEGATLELQAQESTVFLPTVDQTDNQGNPVDSNTSITVSDDPVHIQILDLSDNRMVVSPKEQNSKSDCIRKAP